MIDEPIVLALVSALLFNCAVPLVDAICNLYVVELVVDGLSKK